MTYLIAQLYAMVGLVSILGYLPQIKTLLKGQQAPTEISVKTWTIWTLEGCVAMAYGIVCLQDFLFCFLMGLDLCLMCAIVGLVIHNRYVKFGDCRNFVHAFRLYYFCRPFFAVEKVKRKMSV